MELAENGNLIGDMKIHQDQEVSERDTEDLQDAIVDNQEAIEYFFTDIKYSLETSFALHQAKLIIAAESNFKDLLHLLHRLIGNNFDFLGQVEDLMTALDISENDAQIIQVRSF